MKKETYHFDHKYLVKIVNFGTDRSLQTVKDPGQTAPKRAV